MENEIYPYGMNGGIPAVTGRKRGFGKWIVFAVLAFVVAFAAAAGLSAYKQYGRAQENIVINISENIVTAAGTDVIQNYKNTHPRDKNDKVFYSSTFSASGGEARFDYGLTEDALAGVTSLRIDMRFNNDLSALKYFHSLQSITIESAWLMTDADVAALNDTPAVRVEFILDANEIKSWDPQLPDFTLCNCTDKFFTVLNIDFADENRTYALYHVLSRYYPSVACAGLDYGLYKQVDDKLTAILGKVDFSNCRDGKDKLLKLMIAEVKYLYYDEVVSDYSMTHDVLEEGTYVYQLCVNYNDYQLTSTLLTDSSPAYGCCTNFTSLYLALCIKTDTECYMIDGQRSADTGFLHDWNYAKADNEYYFIDPTETNRWFKRSTGMYYGYYGKFIRGDTDIFDDESFYNSFRKQIFETYHSFVRDTYVFFNDISTVVTVPDRNRSVVMYNVSSVPITKRYVNLISAGMTGAEAAFAAAAVILCIGLLIRKKRSY